LYNSIFVFPNLPEEGKKLNNTVVAKEIVYFSLEENLLSQILKTSTSVVKANELKDSKQATCQKNVIW
jgi:uncharacterized protein YaaW (UPF0174 family)